MKTIDDVSGVILAGGKSSRYGKNKAFIKINGIPLIEKVITVMGSVFQELIIITNTPHKYSHLRLPVYKDLIEGLGPLGGIFTGLTAISKDAGFFVACDMPSLNRELLRHMVECKDDFDAVVPRISGKMEALYALYRNTCLPAIRRQIDSREYQIFRFFPEVSVRYVDEGEIRQFDPELRSFFNVNTPQELQEIQQPATRFNDR
ncbi:MAG: molybdenum cofactor guanylyltransferase [Desulfatiglandaceae bacterium]